MPNAPDWLAWAAGIVDGEGCIRLLPYNASSGKRRVYRAWQIRISVSNTDPRMLMKLRDMFGGAIHSKQTRMMRGDPYKRRPQWEWIVACKKAHAVLTQIRPWLIAKAEQADLAIASRKLIRTNSKGSAFTEVEHAYLEQLAGQMSALKRQTFTETV